MQRAFSSTIPYNTLEIGSGCREVTVRCWSSLQKSLHPPLHCHSLLNEDPIYRILKWWSLGIQQLVGLEFPVFTIKEMITQGGVIQQDLCTLGWGIITG